MTDQTNRLIPEGLWLMNPARSQRLIPGTHTLWIVKNDGKTLIFASVETNDAGDLNLTSWQGEYDGPAAEVTGSGMMAKLTAPSPGEMLISGNIPDMGPFTEHCVLSEDGKRLRCTGTIAQPSGTIGYVDDFDWVGPTPGLPAKG